MCKLLIHREENHGTRYVEPVADDLHLDEIENNKRVRKPNTRIFNDYFVTYMAVDAPGDPIFAKEALEREDAEL